MNANTDPAVHTPVKPPGTCPGNLPCRHAWPEPTPGEGTGRDKGGVRQRRRGLGERLIPTGLSQPWGPELDLAINRRAGRVPNKGAARTQGVFKGCGAAAGKEGALRGFLEASGLGIAPTSLRLGARVPPVGLPRWGRNWGAKAREGWSRAGPPRGVRTERLRALCLRKMELKKLKGVLFPPRVRQPDSSGAFGKPSFWSLACLSVWEHTYLAYEKEPTILSTPCNIWPWLCSHSAALQVRRGPRAARYFGGMEQMAAAPDAVGFSSGRGCSPVRGGQGGGLCRSGRLFIGCCLKCQVRLDALNARASHRTSLNQMK